MKPDRTRNERQARRRDREKQWLRNNGWKSWEALHTALMSGKVYLTQVKADKCRALYESNISAKLIKGR